MATVDSGVQPLWHPVLVSRNRWVPSRSPCPPFRPPAGLVGGVEVEDLHDAGPELPLHAVPRDLRALVVERVQRVHGEGVRELVPAKGAAPAGCLLAVQCTASCTSAPRSARRAAQAQGNAFWEFKSFESFQCGIIKNSIGINFRLGFVEAQTPNGKPQNPKRKWEKGSEKGNEERGESPKPLSHLQTSTSYPL